MFRSRPTVPSSLSSRSVGIFLGGALTLGSIACSSSSDEKEESGDGGSAGIMMEATGGTSSGGTTMEETPSGGAQMTATGGVGGDTPLGTGGTPFMFPTDDVTDALPTSIISPMDIWMITLPIEDTNPSRAGKPMEIKPPEFEGTVMAPWYYVSNEDEVVFRALCACDDEALAAGRTDCGYHTATSSYARSELRELAEWSTSVGEHIMETDVTITHVSTTGKPKSDVVVNQIHDETDDIVLVRLREPRGSARIEPTGTFCESGCSHPLVVEGSVLGDDGKPTGQGSAIWYGVLDENYVVGTPFHTRIHAHSGQVDVYFWYEGDEEPLAPSVVVPANTTGCYFKAGSYNHSGMKEDKGYCEPNDYAEVRFTRIEVEHPE